MSIEREILTALETYQWTPEAVVYNFAQHLHCSESHMRRQLDYLVESGEIEKIVEGKHFGKPRFIYQLKKCSPVK